MAKGQATSDDTLKRVAVRGGLHSGAAFAALPGPLPHDRGHRGFRPSRPPHLYFPVQQSRSIRRVVNYGFPVTSPPSSLSRVASARPDQSKETRNSTTDTQSQ